MKLVLIFLLIPLFTKAVELPVHFNLLSSVADVYTNNDKLKSENENNNSILEIISGDSTDIKTTNIINAISSYIDKDGTKHTIDCINIGNNLNNETDLSSVIVDSCIKKIKSVKYNIVIIIGDNTLSLIRSRIKEIPEDTNVIYASVSSFDDKLRAEHRNSTAICYENNFWANLQLGIKIFPNTDTIGILVHDKSKCDYIKKKYSNKLKSNIKLVFITIADTSLGTKKSLESNLNEFPKNSFLISLDWDEYLNNNSEVICRLINKSYPIPIFTQKYNLLEFCIGGYISRFSDLGRITGEQCVSIFDGKKAYECHLSVNPSHYIFNSNKLKIFKIKETDLPANSFVINNEKVFGNLKFGKFEVLSLLCALLILSLLLILLYFKLRKLRFSKMLCNYLPVRIFVYDATGNILFSHKGIPNDMDIGNIAYNNINEIPWINYAQIKDVITSVYRSGKSKIIHYNHLK